MLNNTFPISLDPYPIYAILGGTFDPIHYGHLQPAIALAKEIGLTHISLLPNNVPPHRPQPEANTEQRLAMLKLAIQNQPIFSIDERELTRNTPSYTIETLEELRREKGHTMSLAFIIGLDSLINLPTWHRWQELLNYCHLLVCNRPGYDLNTANPELKSWLALHQTHHLKTLQYSTHGSVYLANTPLRYISATEIRQRLMEGRHCQDLLPSTVQQYIQKNGLYPLSLGLPQ